MRQLVEAGARPRIGLRICPRPDVCPTNNVSSIARFDNTLVHGVEDFEGRHIAPSEGPRSSRARSTSVDAVSVTLQQLEIDAGRRHSGLPSGLSAAPRSACIADKKQRNERSQRFRTSLCRLPYIGVKPPTFAEDTQANLRLSHVAGNGRFTSAAIRRTGKKNQAPFMQQRVKFFTHQRHRRCRVSTISSCCGGESCGRRRRRAEICSRSG